MERRTRERFGREGTIRFLPVNGYPSPFAVVCVDTDSDCDAQALWWEIDEQLRNLDVHDKPVLLCHPSGIGQLGEYLSISDVVTVQLSSSDLISVLTAHPPRAALIKRITADTPIGLLNPYVYRGPIGANMFVGRRRQIDKLCTLQASYALVGPRAIGKTSLINRAYERLCREGHPAVRVEFSQSLTEQDVTAQVFARFVDDYDARPSIQSRMSSVRLQRFIERFVKKFPHKKMAVFIDEADQFQDRCPALAMAFRSLHNHDVARFTLVGYKQLRKAVSSSRKVGLINVLQELPLTQLSIRECGELIVSPMTRLGISIPDPMNVTEAIYEHSGGSPSRIQLLCSAIIAGLEDTTPRVITPEDARSAMTLPQVNKVLTSWYTESTSLVEKYVACIASLHTPCTEKQLIREVQDDLPEMATYVIQEEIQDLITADILDYQREGLLDFTFPLGRKLARPLGNVRKAVDELRRAARQTLHSHSES